MPRIDMRKDNRLGMAAVLGLEGYCRTHLSKPLYELVKLRASQVNQCHHCIAMHTTALRKSGETAERIAAGGTGELPATVLDDRENAALLLTDHLTRIDPHVGVSDEVWQVAAAQFDDAELGNLILGIATINVFNRVAIASRLDA